MTGRPIKIEILLDENPAPTLVPPQTLLNRLAPVTPVAQTPGIYVRHTEALTP
jgi:hypothetical protein